MGRILRGRRRPIFRRLAGFVQAPLAHQHVTAVIVETAQPIGGLPRLTRQHLAAGLHPVRGLRARNQTGETIRGEVIHRQPEGVAVLGGQAVEDRQAVEEPAAALHPRPQAEPLQVCSGGRQPWSGRTFSSTWPARS